MEIQSTIVCRILLLLSLSLAQVVDFVADDGCDEEGLCALNALQRSAELLRDEESCMTVTVGTCHWFNCAASRGATTCSKGRCACAPGYCSDGYKCTEAPAPAASPAVSNFVPSQRAGSPWAPAPASRFGPSPAQNFGPSQGLPPSFGPAPAQNFGPSQGVPPNFGPAPAQNFGPSQRIPPNFGPAPAPNFGPSQRIPPNFGPASGGSQMAPGAQGMPSPMTGGASGASNPWAKYMDPKIWSDPKTLQNMFNPSAWQNMYGR